MVRIGAVFIALAIALGLAACGSGSGEDESDSTAASSDEPIKLGFAIGETGFMAPFDDPARTAAEFAIEDINADGGAAGRTFETTSADTKSKPELAGDAATQVLGEDSDVVVTSCDFDQGSPAAIVAQEEGVLAFSTCAGSTAFGPQGIGPLAFTMATAAPAEGATMAEWAMEQGYENGASLLDDTIEFTKQSDYGFRTRFEELGGNLVAQETFKQGDASIASQINALKSASPAPDFIYLASYMPDQASAMKQMRAAGLDMPILADEDVDGDYWKEAVPGISDVFYATYGSIYGDDPDDTVNELVTRYEEEEGKLPDNAAFLTGYAMVQAIAQAVEGADGSTEGTALQEQLETFDDEQLLLPTTFDTENHITLSRTLRVMEIQNEETTFLEEWTPENVPVPSGG